MQSDSDKSDVDLKERVKELKKENRSLVESAMNFSQIVKNQKDTIKKLTFNLKDNQDFENDIRLLEQEKEQYRDKLRDSVKKHEEKILSFNLLIDNLKEENAHFRSELIEKKRDVEKLEEERIRTHELIKSHEVELENVNDLLRNLASESSEDERSKILMIELLRSQHQEDMKKNMDERQSEKKEMNRLIGEMKRRSEEESFMNFAFLSQKKKMMIEMLEELSERERVNQDQQNKTKLRIEELEKDNEEKKFLMLRMEERTARMQIEISNLKKDLDLEGQKYRSYEELKTAEIKTLEDYISALEKQNTDLLKGFTHCKLTKKDLSDEIRDLKREIDDVHSNHERKICTFKEQIEHAQNEVKNTAVTLSMYENKKIRESEEVEEEIQGLKNQLSGRIDHILSLKKKNESLRKDFDSFQKEYDCVQKDLKSTKELLRHKEANLEDLRETMDMMDDERIMAIQRVEEMKDKLYAYEKEQRKRMNEKEEEVNVQTNELMATKKKLELLMSRDSEHENKLLMLESKKLKDEKEELENEIKGLKESMECDKKIEEYHHKYFESQMKKLEGEKKKLEEENIQFRNLLESTKTLELIQHVMHLMERHRQLMNQGLKGQEDHFHRMSQMKAKLNSYLSKFEKIGDFVNKQQQHDQQRRRRSERRQRSQTNIPISKTKRRSLTDDPKINKNRTTNTPNVQRELFQKTNSTATRNRRWTSFSVEKDNNIKNIEHRQGGSVDLMIKKKVSPSPQMPRRKGLPRLRIQSSSTPKKKKMAIFGSASPRFGNSKQINVFY